MLMPARGFGAQQVIDVLADLVDVEFATSAGARFGPDMESTSAVSRSASPMMTRVYSFSAGVRQLALQQLRRAAQAAERIFDLVRELPDHQAAAVETRQQIVLARDALPLRGVGQLEQQVRAGDLAGERRDGHVQGARLARRAGGPHDELAIGDALAGGERAAQDRRQPVGVVQEVAERAAARLVEAEGEQVLRGDVGVDGAQLRIEHDDAGRQRVEQIRRIEVRERRRQGVLSGHGRRAGCTAALRLARPDGVGGIEDRGLVDAEA